MARVQAGLAPALRTPEQLGMAHLFPSDVRACYADWPTPTVIISDGAYGIHGFPGDPSSPNELPAWYAEHLAAWTAAATAETTLWFWNTEIGWATMNPYILAHQWVYAGTHIWDKGMAYVAGRNTRRLRGFPIVTEVCVRYVRPPQLVDQAGTLQTWLRAEWERTGLPWALANTACGVKTAATRKYLARDGQWYCPPAEMLQRLAVYANQYGDPGNRPYFGMSLDGEVEAPQLLVPPIQRAIWNTSYGITNVWPVPTVRGRERVRGPNGRPLHPNQKPLTLFERIIRASSLPGSVIWEPFGGLAPAAVMSVALGRACYTAEQNAQLIGAAKKRLIPGRASSYTETPPEA